MPIHTHKDALDLKVSFQKTLYADDTRKM